MIAYATIMPMKIFNFGLAATIVKMTGLENPRGKVSKCFFYHDLDFLYYYGIYIMQI